MRRLAAAVVFLVPGLAWAHGPALAAAQGPAAGKSHRVEKLSDRSYDAELANGLGNLASRILALVEKVTGGRVPAPGVELAEDQGPRAPRGPVVADELDHREELARSPSGETTTSCWRAACARERARQMAAARERRVHFVPGPFVLV